MIERISRKIVGNCRLDSAIQETNNQIRTTNRLSEQKVQQKELVKVVH